MRVWPKNEDVRRMIKHPSGVAFAEDISTPAEWPDDQFTTRRLRDGDVLLEQPVEGRTPAAPGTDEERRDRDARAAEETEGRLAEEQPRPTTERRR